MKSFLQNFLDELQYESLLNQEDKIEHIILIGAHGTGKTTLAEALASELELPVTESVARKTIEILKQLPIKVLKEVSTEILQQGALCEMSRWDFVRWNEVENIMTRCPLDTLAYTKVAIANARNDDERGYYERIYKYHLHELKRDEVAMHMLTHSLFVYLPIEFEIKDDGVRPTNSQYQKDVDRAMRELMWEFGINPLVATGSVERRTERILKHLVESAKELISAASFEITNGMSE